MQDFLSERIEFQGTLGHKHSSAMGWFEGKEVYKFKSDVCHSMITYDLDNRCDKLFVFFPTKVGYGDGEWVEWVANESPFASGVLTKTAKEGFTSGFEIDTRVDRVMMAAAIMVLRYQFESRYYWQWFDFVKMGFSKFDAYVLATNFVVNEVERVEVNTFNYNHRVVLAGASYKAFRGDFYNPEGQCLFGGLERIDSLSIDGWGSDSSYDCYDAPKIKNVGSPKDTLTKYLKELKEKSECVD
jgi:hypothetical protein